MAKVLDELTISALKLPGRQRLALAGFLLETTDATDANSDEAWEQEIVERIHAVDAGSVTGVPWEQALQEADERLAS